MILGVPVVDGHDLTKTLLESLVASVVPCGFRVVIIDNASKRPYKKSDYAGYPFPVNLISYEENQGYYRPLLDLYKSYPDEAIGLVHNDMLIYQHGWNQIMGEAFKTDPLLGLIGLFGSSEIDEKGGRGYGSMAYFVGNEVNVAGKIYKGQDQTAAARITGLEPACVLDSLFMMFKRQVIPALVSKAEAWEDLPLAHFYDRIWPLRTIEAGYRVAVLGAMCDHIGGLTCTANQRYANDCRAWLEARNIPYENPETEMYLVAERRFLNEYREQKHFIPCKIDNNYSLEHTHDTTH